jgi:hypothetical protein
MHAQDVPHRSGSHLLSDDELARIIAAAQAADPQDDEPEPAPE